ncbi:GNAT family N-acetyltransferase [Nonomuraea angiospora]|uniref:GNAT family N-acetyltransferase n=1 Tax=Nonomuraea angiospora TaxID=46172 RepID=UPI0038D46080
MGVAWHTHALADPHQEHIVAKRGEDLVGFAVLAGLHASDDIELRRMVIAPTQRRARLGRTLLRAVLTRACQYHGSHRIWLDVKAHNHRARALYGSEGSPPPKPLPGRSPKRTAPSRTSSSWFTSPDRRRALSPPHSLPSLLDMPKETRNPRGHTPHPAKAHPKPPTCTAIPR